MSTAIKNILIHPADVDIPLGNQDKLIIILNQTLAHLIDLKMQVMQAHCKLIGKHFIVLAEMFDMLSKELDIYADRVKQRLTIGLQKCFGVSEA